MKKSLVFSVIVHIVLASIAILAIFSIPDTKKTEPVKIKILIPSAKKPPLNPRPLEIPAKIVPTLPQPQPVPPAPMHPQTFQPVSKSIPPTAAPSVPAAVSPKAPDLPAQKGVENPPAPPKAVVSKPAPVETVKFDPKAKEQYVAYLRQLIDERKIYPKNAKRLKQTGTVMVKFKVLEDGTVKNISIIESSGFDSLDQATKEVLENIGRFKALPKEMGDEPADVTLPVEYKIR